MRAETQAAFEDESADYIERLMIAFYVRDGWDRMWPWGNVPAWLWPRYDPTQLRQMASALERAAWWPRLD